MTGNVKLNEKNYVRNSSQQWVFTVTVQEQISLHRALFLDQNRQQIDTIKSKTRHRHRKCNFPLPSMMESRFVFLFSFTVPSFPKPFLLCASEPGEKWFGCCISFNSEANLQHAHTHTRYVHQLWVAATVKQHSTLATLKPLTVRCVTLNILL